MSNWFMKIFCGSGKCDCKNCGHGGCCGDKKEGSVNAPKTENKPTENADKVQ